MMKSLKPKKMRKMIVFVCVALRPFSKANPRKSGFSALNAKAGLTKLALEASFNTSAIIVYLIKFYFYDYL